MWDPCKNRTHFNHWAISLACVSFIINVPGVISLPLICQSCCHFVGGHLNFFFIGKTFTYTLCVCLCMYMFLKPTGHDREQVQYWESFTLVNIFTTHPQIWLTYIQFVMKIWFLRIWENCQQNNAIENMCYLSLFGCFNIILFFWFIYLLMCVGVFFPACKSVHHIPTLTKEGIVSPGTGVIHSCEPPNRCWEPNKLSGRATSDCNLCAIFPALVSFSNFLFKNFFCGFFPPYIKWE